MIGGGATGAAGADEGTAATGVAGCATGGNDVGGAAGGVRDASGAGDGAGGGITGTSGRPQAIAINSAPASDRRTLTRRWSPDG
jgi:hypothetical protein